MKKQSILELNLQEFHSEIDSQILEIKESGAPFEEKVEKIRKRRAEIAKEQKYATKDRYKEYLDSFEWDRKRKAVLKRADYTCEGCGNGDRKLEVHHLTYERKGMELLTDLVAYCGICHELAHGYTYHKDMIHWWAYLNLSTNKRPDGLLISEMNNLTKEEIKKMVKEI